MTGREGAGVGADDGEAGGLRAHRDKRPAPLGCLGAWLALDPGLPPASTSSSAPSTRASSALLPFPCVPSPPPLPPPPTSPLPAPSSLARSHPLFRPSRRRPMLGMALLPVSCQPACRRAPASPACLLIAPPPACLVPALPACQQCGLPFHKPHFERASIECISFSSTLYEHDRGERLISSFSAPARSS